MRSSFLAILFLFSLVSLTGCDDESTITPPPLQYLTIEGKEYPIVKIGNLTWTASNYAGAGGVSYDAANSKPVYGKYYSKAELDVISVPDGWRIPTMADYAALAQFYGITIPSKAGEGEAIKALISTANWNHAVGTNASGFNAYPGGYVFGNANPIDGDIAEFWTVDGKTFSIQESGENLSSLRIALYESTNSPDFRFNVRFVKTEP